jgi:inner membrane transporter RhtA
LPARVVGILLSLDPAMAALAGFVVLGEGLRLRDCVAIALVAVASAGASLTAAEHAVPEA